LLLPQENESATFVQLLRPKDWLNNDFAQVVEVQNESGETEEVILVWLELPEMGVVGWAELLGVIECEKFQTGKGNLVTGTFCHLAPETINLEIENIDPIGCTPNHPFWSVDRQDYISAGGLVQNERVLLYNGETKRVINKLSRPGPEFVYNIEIFGEHVYHVTSDGVLVHNSCVLGQNMKERVKPAAKALRVDWLKTPWSWTKNTDFLQKQMELVRKGKGKIFDIGGQRGRYQGPQAIYSREKELLKENGFTRVFTGKWITGTNGKKFRLYEWIQ
jgi:hypothetical protein